MNIGSWKKGLGLFACALVLASNLGAMAPEETSGKCGVALGRARHFAEPRIWGLPEEGRSLTPDHIVNFGFIKDLKGNLYKGVLNKDEIALNGSFLKLVHYVAVLGCTDVDVYEKIKECGGDIDCRCGILGKNYAWLTALGVAVVDGKVDVVRALLAAGANPDEKCDRAYKANHIMHTYPSWFWCENSKSVRTILSECLDRFPEDSRAEAWRIIKELFDAVPCEAPCVAVAEVE